MRRFIILALAGFFVLMGGLLYMALAPGAVGHFEQKASTPKRERPIRKKVSETRGSDTNQTQEALVLEVIEGVVSNKETGQPLEGARIWWATALPGEEEPTDFVTSDELGRYQLEITPLILAQNSISSQLMVHADAEGFHRTFALVAPGNIEAPVLCLSPKLEPEIWRLENPSGEPVVGARITVNRGPFSEIVRFSDDQGRFAWEPVSPLHYRSMPMVQAEGFVTTFIPYPEFWEWNKSRVVVLDPGELMINTIEVPEGNPVVGAHTYFDNTVSNHYITDEAGQIKVPIAKPVKSVRVHAPGFIAQIGPEELAKDIWVIEPGPLCTGTLRNGLGQPLAGVPLYNLNEYEPWDFVEPHEPDVYTNAQGGFELNSSSLSLLRVLAVHPLWGKRVFSHSLEEGEEVAWVWREPVEVSGRVVDETGEGIPYATVGIKLPLPWLRPKFPFEGGKSKLKNFTADAEGYYRLTPFYEEEEVHVMASGYQMHKQQISIDDWPEELVLKPEVTISGKLVTSRGEPVPTTYVFLHQWSAEKKFRYQFRALQIGLTDGKGHFYFPGLSPGPYTISLGNTNRNLYSTERVYELEVGNYEIELLAMNPFHPAALMDRYYPRWKKNEFGQ